MPWNSWNIAKVDIKHQSINQSINCIKGNTFFHLTFHLSSLTWYIRYAWHLHFVLKLNSSKTNEQIFSFIWAIFLSKWNRKMSYLGALREINRAEMTVPLITCHRFILLIASLLIWRSLLFPLVIWVSFPICRIWLNLLILRDNGTRVSWRRSHYVLDFHFSKRHSTHCIIW